MSPSDKERARDALLVELAKGVEVLLHVQRCTSDPVVILKLKQPEQQGRLQSVRERFEDQAHG